MEFVETLHIIHSRTGLFHTITAVLAMVFGAIVLFNNKGAKRHKRLGYLYIIHMILLNVSAFGIYTFGGFSVFHGLALISMATVLAGMVPAIRKKNDNGFAYHFYFMSWSVVGLYCAFWAEIGVRFFEMKYFWWVVAFATMFTAFTGARIIKREAKKLNLA